MAAAHGVQAYKRLGTIVVRHGSRRSDTPGLSISGRFLFVLVLAIVVALFLIYQLTQTLYQLHLTKGERDRT